MSGNENGDDPQSQAEADLQKVVDAYNNIGEGLAENAQNLSESEIIEQAQEQLDAYIQTVNDVAGGGDDTESGS